MNNQTFLLTGGVLIAAFGIMHIISEKFARDFFFASAFPNSWILKIWHRFLFSLLSEAKWVFIIRFVLGPILLIVGLALIATNF